MKIVVDARDSQLSRVGVAVYSSNLINQFSSMTDDRHEFIYLITDSLPPPKVAEKVLPIAPSATDSIFKKLLWYYRLPKLLSLLNADLYFGNFIGLPFQRNFSCPIVSTAHDAASINTTSLVGNRFARYKNKYFVNSWVKKVSHIICISNYCKEEFTNIFGDLFSKKSTVIHHGLPIEFNNIQKPNSFVIEDIKKKFTDGNEFIITIGTVTPKKNYDRLIEAFSKIDNKSSRLIICGVYGYGSGEILSSPSRHNVANRVLFLNSLNTENIYKLMCSANCFVFPSLYEGFGIPLLEAFSVGLPVICSNATCLPEIAGDAAIFFDPYSVPELTAAINEVMSNHDLRNTLREAGFKRVSNFSWKKSANEHISVFENVVSSK